MEKSQKWVEANPSAQSSFLKKVIVLMSCWHCFINPIPGRWGEEGDLSGLRLFIQNLENCNFQYLPKFYLKSFNKKKIVVTAILNLWHRFEGWVLKKPIENIENEDTCYLLPSLCFDYCWCHQKYVIIHLIKN